MSDTPPAKAPGWALWLPLASFVVFVLFVGVQMMRPKHNEIKSQMIGKPLPAFQLPASADGQPGLSDKDFVGGKPRLLNIFASWCIPCRAEEPVLVMLAKQGVEIDGIAIRDHKEDLAGFLARYGNPYTRIGADNVSAVQLALGSSGVPETFVIDAKGIIRYQHIGDIGPEETQEMLAKLKEAEQ